MKTRKDILIILCAVTILLAGCQGVKDSGIEILGHSASSPLGNGIWSDKLAEQANFILILSSQSKHATTLQGEINGIAVFRGRYKSKYLDSYYHYFADLEIGEYTLKIKSSNGTTLEETIEIREDEGFLWAYLTFQNETDSEPSINLIQSYERIWLD